MKRWQDQIPASFGCDDLKFGEHDDDQKRAMEMLKTAIDQKATMADIVDEAEKFLKSKNASSSHIQRESKKIETLKF